MLLPEKISFSREEMDDFIFLLQWSYGFVRGGPDPELEKELQRTIFELKGLLRGKIL